MMRFLNSSRLRGINFFLFFAILYFVFSINSQTHSLYSKPFLQEIEFSITILNDSNKEFFLAEFEEGEGEFFYYETVYLANLGFLAASVSKFSTFEFIFHIYTIQDHLLNLPPPIS